MGAEPWHRMQVGGLWEEIGQLQYDFLLAQGLRADHYFLDIACGSLRAGVKLIPYLDSGHYYGIDRDSELLRRGYELELDDEARQKQPVLAQMEDFDFQRLGRQFDFAIAQSLFTHLPVNQITRCLMNAERALR